MDIRGGTGLRQARGRCSPASRGAGGAVEVRPDGAARQTQRQHHAGQGTARTQHRQQGSAFHLASILTPDDGRRKLSRMTVASRTPCTGMCAPRRSRAAIIAPDWGVRCYVGEATRGKSSRKARIMATAATVAALTLAGGAYFSAHADDARKPEVGAGAVIDPDNVELASSQTESIDVTTVSERTFPLQRDAVGNIDFNEDLSTQVFTPYQGRIVKLFAKLGDNVSTGQDLFTIESPDLIQADSTAIAAAGVLDLTTRALERARELYKVQGIAEKDLQQAVSDQQTAEGALKRGTQRGGGLRQDRGGDRPDDQDAHHRPLPGGAEPHFRTSYGA